MFDRERESVCVCVCVCEGYIYIYIYIYIYRVDRILYVYSLLTRTTCSLRLFVVVSTINIYITHFTSRKKEKETSFA